MSERAPGGVRKRYGACDDAMTRTEQRLRRQKRQRQIIRRVSISAVVLLFIVTSVLMLTGGCGQDETPAETPAPVTATPAPVPMPTPTPPAMEREAINPFEKDRIALARMVWGEARGCSTTEQAAVVWCVLNRFDSGEAYYADCMTIYDIVTQEDQFEGYNPSFPIEAHILALVDDVLARWMMEKVCVGDVGRVLPADYLFFTGDGTVNTFTTEWRGGQTWDWSLDSPYEEGAT